MFAGPLGGAGCGAGVLGRDLDLSLAPAADDRPPSPLTTNLIIYMGFLSLTAGTGTGTGMVLVLDSKCVTQNQNRQLRRQPLRASLRTWVDIVFSHLLPHSHSL